MSGYDDLGVECLDPVQRGDPILDRARPDDLDDVTGEQVSGEEHLLVGEERDRVAYRVRRPEFV